MSLQGSLETFSIPDVLVLLATTKKTGELRVVGGQVDGRLWFSEGSVTQSTVGGATISPVDGVFEILRLVEGTFSFNSDVKAPKAGNPQPVEMVLADAQNRLSEWHDIAKVVPHLDCTLRLAPELPDDEVVVGRSQWEIMVAVAGGTSVRQLMDASGMSEFDACKAVRDLITGHLLAIDASVKPRSARSEPAKAMSIPVDEAIAPAKESTNGAGDAANGNGAKVNGTGAAEAPAPSKSASVTAEKKPTTAAEAAQKEGRDDQVIRSNATDTGGTRAVSTTKGSPATEALDEPAAARAAKAEPKAPAPKADPRKADDHAKDDMNPLVAQLAALGVDEDDKEMQAKVAQHLAQGGELPEPEGDEPINRGLLLKFLSSVRN